MDGIARNAKERRAKAAFTRQSSIREGGQHRDVEEVRDFVRGAEGRVHVVRRERQTQARQECQNQAQQQVQGHFGLEGKAGTVASSATATFTIRLRSSASEMRASSCLRR